jgi:hypothetical protein
MPATDLLSYLNAAGFRIAVVERRQLVVSPASRLTDAERDEIRHHRDELVAMLVPPGDATDDCHRCVECAHYRPAARRCTDPARAGLLTPEVGPDLAGVPQRCPAFASASEAAAETTPDRPQGAPEPPTARFPALGQPEVPPGPAQRP